MTDHPRPADGTDDQPGNEAESAHAQARSAEPARDVFAGPDWDGASTSRWRNLPGAATARRVKVSHRRRKALRRRRRVGLAFVLLGGLIVLIGAYLVITGLLARGDLEDVRGNLAKLQAQVTGGDLPGARKTAAAIADDAGSAHSLTSGPVWALAADVPGGGEPLQTLRGVAAATDTLGSNVLPGLITATQRLDPAKLRQADGTINLAPIAVLAPSLQHQSSLVDDAVARLSKLQATTWLASADTARADAITKLTSFGQTLHSADLAAQVAPAMLGQNGPRRYLVAFETEAELRGLGGLPGAFAIVRADHGSLSFERFESDTTLLRTPSGVHLGDDFDNLYYGSDATTDYLDSNVSPHFPNAARIWTAMWQRHSGQVLDGAVAIDPTALQYLLAVTGPTKLPDGTTVGANNVVSLTQQQVYAKFPSTDQTARKNYQLAIAKAVSSRLLARTGNTTALVKAAGRAAGERRLLAWSSNPTVEAQLATTALGGAVPDSAAPFTGLAINNAGGNKLDYYLDTSLDWRSTGCSETRDVTVTIHATNNAPAKLPAYVPGITGKPGYPPRPGDNVLLFGLYATQGAQFSSVTLNGKPFSAGTGTERGHPVYTMTVPLPRAQPQTIVVHLTEPASPERPTVLTQPTVRTMRTTIHSGSCK